MMRDPLHIVLRCAKALVPRVRYVFDTLLLAASVPVVYPEDPPAKGIWLLYGPPGAAPSPDGRCVAIVHCPESWHFIEARLQARTVATVCGLTSVLPGGHCNRHGTNYEIPFDLVANAFYFLSSWSERTENNNGQGRKLFASSIYARLGVPQDVVDGYLQRLMQLLDALCDRLDRPRFLPNHWPHRARYAVVLSHDVDFIPRGIADVVKQGAKTMLRHLVRQRDPADAALAGAGLARALWSGRDPYGCIPEIIERERRLGVRASFQVAVGHRHPSDVNYRIENDKVRDYLRVIPEADFDLCLHGSYRSTERLAWYVEEVELLTQRLTRPLGSRQHYLSFDYDKLFSAQEEAGIQYDMSMGYPDHPGPRAGFSYPYFPYCLKEDRPYDVLQISLCLMDVTLRSYLGLKGARAWRVIEDTLNDLRDKGGCASLVWHPIVFGRARDPGFDRLFWDIVDHVGRTEGLATDGGTINAFYRRRANTYPSFAPAAGKESAAA